MTITDKEIIEGLIANDEQVTRYFFFEKCTPMLRYIINAIFVNRVEKDELVNELYIYLQEDNWRKLRKFDYRSKLITWLSIVATRFFLKKHDLLIENNDINALIDNGYDPLKKLLIKMDVHHLLERMPNARYREVIHALYIDDMEPRTVANKLGVTIDNLYNIKSRALQQFSQIIKKEDGYDGLY